MVASQANENILDSRPSQFQCLPCLPWPEPRDSAMKARYSLESVIRDHKQVTMLMGCMWGVAETQGKTSCQRGCSEELTPQGGDKTQAEGVVPRPCGTLSNMGLWVEACPSRISPAFRLDSAICASAQWKAEGAHTLDSASSWWQCGRLHRDSPCGSQQPPCP